MDSFSNGPGHRFALYVKWRITPDFHSLKQEVIGNVGSVLWVVMGTIGMVLLIACINVANLLLVRAESRQLELSIRAALGAGRGRIARELLLRERAARTPGRSPWESVSLRQPCASWFPSVRRICRASVKSLSMQARSSSPSFFRSFGAVLRLDSRLEVLAESSATVSLGATRTVSASRERQPVPQYAGRRPGRHGACASGLRRCS